jgi:predicted transcriptional regulator
MEAPYQKEGLKMAQAMLKARMSEAEIARHFGRSKSRIREMVQGKRRPDEYLVQRLEGMSRD